MDSFKPLGGLVTAGLVVSLFAIVVTTALGAGGSDQLLGSTHQSAALVASLVVAGAVAGFISLGRAWQRWNRTPYW